MALTTSETNQVRVDVLGVSVDESTTWTTTGPAGNRNALDVAITERVVTRLLNDIYTRLGDAVGGTNGFSGRFNAVIGDELGADQAAFDALGTNLIQALAAGGGGGRFEYQQTTPSMAWSITHNLGAQFVDVLVLSPGSANPTASQNIVVPSIVYSGPTSCVLNFTESVAGTAIVRK